MMTATQVALECGGHPSRWTIGRYNKYADEEKQLFADDAPARAKEIYNKLNKKETTMEVEKNIPDEEIAAPAQIDSPITLTVDEELKTLIPPLSDGEFKQLEENLLCDGIQDPLFGRAS